MRLLPLILLSIFTACDSQSPEPDSEAVLRAYPLPEGAAPKMEAILSRVLRGDDEARVGRVVEGPNGALIVVAPEGVHEGIAALLADLPADVAATDEANIIMEHWVVLAGDGEPSRPDSLGVISDALQAITDQTGAQSFTLLDRAELVSLDNARAQLSNSQLHLEQLTTVGLDGVMTAEISLRLKDGPSLQSRVRLAPDQTLVLGSLGRFDAEGRTLYHIMRGRAVRL